MAGDLCFPFSIQGQTLPTVNLIERELFVSFQGNCYTINNLFFFVNRVQILTKKKWITGLCTIGDI